MKIEHCPNCNSNQHIKSGIVNDRQRYKCKKCNYYFTVNKVGKKIDTKNYSVFYLNHPFLEISTAHKTNV